jgi:hypothetical protein
VHPVFYAKKLYKDPRNPLLRQTNPEPLLLKVEDGEIEYEVQEVLAIKLIRGKLKYRVKWKGWDLNPNWYPASSLSNSPIILQAFYRVYPNRPSPPRNLLY